VEVSAGALGNSVYSESMGKIATRIREGESLNETLEQTNLASSLMVEMVKVGEQTGALEDMLVGISDFYDEELDNHISRMMALLEPIILVIMGCFVAAILLSMYLPIFQLSTL
jgi:type IV pilus assembly protein PilC